uniref:Uncharacterized protein TCIL3000_10_13530 n=1 Tax=Trypanosoma congolense (strain IL3000) TaxID=1068625 RepID=G0UYV2_TRYCI|nr:unnamed protein product [Trypanosoma congolense IL3000]
MTLLQFIVEWPSALTSSYCDIYTTAVIPVIPYCYPLDTFCTVALILFPSSLLPHCTPYRGITHTTGEHKGVEQLGQCGGRLLLGRQTGITVLKCVGARSLVLKRNPFNLAAAKLFTFFLSSWTLSSRFGRRFEDRCEIGESSRRRRKGFTSCACVCVCDVVTSVSLKL